MVHGRFGVRWMLCMLECALRLTQPKCLPNKMFLVDKFSFQIMRILFNYANFVNKKGISTIHILICTLTQSGTKDIHINKET